VYILTAASAQPSVAVVQPEQETRWSQNLKRPHESSDDEYQSPCGGSPNTNFNSKCTIMIWYVV